jgi:hypothetical protein
MGKRKFRGHDPAQAARRAWETRRDPAKWGVNEEARQLPQNADVHSTPETRTTTRRVQRFDCFATLKLSDHQFNAVRRYQADLAENCGCGDGGGGCAEPVDGGGGSRELVTARMMAAGSRVMALYQQLTLPDREMLYVLSAPVWIEGRACNWKGEVKRLRGLIDKDSQAQAVKTMAENVRLAYVEIDNGQQRKAA